MTDDTESASVLELIDQLEEMLTTARRVPLSANVVVNEDNALELIDRARLGLPEELVHARHTLEDRQRIVAEAEQEGERILSRAEQEAERLIKEAGQRAVEMVSDHAITAQANAHAATILAEAEEKAASTRAEADAYAHEVMVRLEEQLVRSLGTVRKGIDTLPAPPGSKRRRKDNQ
jgi:vacuolar-type H+-ATPase subunit H